MQTAQILNAQEYNAMRAAMSPNHRLLFDGAVLTGMRMEEYWRFIQHPEWFHSERQYIALPREAVKKQKSRYSDRTVLLSHVGARAIGDLVYAIKHDHIKPITRMGWQEDLKRAVRKVNERAGFTNPPGLTMNVRGIMPKMTRKTWVSWLVTTYPDDGLRIAASLGHDPRTMIEHYLSLPFSAVEKEQIRPLVVGWGGRT